MHLTAHWDANACRRNDKGIIEPKNKTQIPDRGKVWLTFGFYMENFRFSTKNSCYRMVFWSSITWLILFSLNVQDEIEHFWLNHLDLNEILLKIFSFNHRAHLYCRIEQKKSLKVKDLSLKILSWHIKRIDHFLLITISFIFGRNSFWSSVCIFDEDKNK